MIWCHYEIESTGNILKIVWKANVLKESSRWKKICLHNLQPVHNLMKSAVTEEVQNHRSHLSYISQQETGCVWKNSWITWQTDDGISESRFVFSHHTTYTSSAKHVTMILMYVHAIRLSLVRLIHNLKSSPVSTNRKLIRTFDWNAKGELSIFLTQAPTLNKSATMTSD